MANRNNQTFRLYRFYDAEGALLYIGQTGRLPFKRLIEHVGDKPWADEMAKWVVDPRTWATEAAVLAAEKAAIRAERPRYNIAHNERNPLRHQPAARPAPTPRPEPEYSFWQEIGNGWLAAPRWKRWTLILASLFLAWIALVRITSWAIDRYLPFPHTPTSVDSRMATVLLIPSMLVWWLWYYVIGRIRIYRVIGDKVRRPPAGHR